MRIRGNPARRLAALALAMVLLAAGCGDQSTPADAAPELADQLARVDRAVTSSDDALIRHRVEALVASTEAARDSGTIDDAQADRILSAAEELLGRLPAAEPEPKPSPSPTPSEPTTPSPEGDEDEDKEEKPPKPEPEPKPPKDEHHKDEHHKGKGHDKDD